MWGYLINYFFFQRIINWFIHPVAFKKWGSALPPRAQSDSCRRLNSASYPFVSLESLACSRQLNQCRLLFVALLLYPPWHLFSSLKKLGFPPLSSLRFLPSPRSRVLSSWFDLMRWNLSRIFNFGDLVLFCLQFKIALCQLSVTADKSRNIAHARRAIEEAASKGAQLVLLPVSYTLHFIFAYLFVSIWILDPSHARRISALNLCIVVDCIVDS